MVNKIEQKHKQYDRRYEDWVDLRILSEGERAVKAAGTRFLPKLSGQDGPTLLSSWGDDEPTVHIADYESYKNRASFLNAVERTSTGMVGFITRKDYDLQWPEGDRDYLKAVGVDLEPLEEVVDTTLDQVITVGRYGHLVDRTGTGDPYIAGYIAEAIWDWKTTKLEGRPAVTYVNLYEAVDGIDETGKAREYERHRTLNYGLPEPVTEDEDKLVSELGYDAFLQSLGITQADMVAYEGDELPGRVYYQEVWDETRVLRSDKEASKQFVRTAVIVPRANGGAALHEIPFTFVNPDSTKAQPSKPPLADLAAINISHYRNSADTEHGAHLTALPMPWFAGFKFKTHVTLGSGTAAVTSEPNAKAGFLEFSGAGLGFLQGLMDDKKKEMAALGARLLEEQPNEREAEAVMMLRHSGEESVLARISRTVSTALTYSLEYIQAFRTKKSAKVQIVLNTDFGTKRIKPEMLGRLFEGVLSGFVSWNTLFWNLKKAELIEPGIDADEEMERIMSGLLEGIVQPPQKESAGGNGAA